MPDISTTAQNVAQALNGIIQVYLNVEGAQNTASISAATLVMGQRGRIARVSVLAAGSAAGAVYDANNASATTNKIYVIPMTVGVFEVKFPLNYGLVVAPGTGQAVAVSWSVDSRP